MKATADVAKGVCSAMYRCIFVKFGLKKGKSSPCVCVYTYLFIQICIHFVHIFMYIWAMYRCIFVKFGLKKGKNSPCVSVYMISYTNEYIYIVYVYIYIYIYMLYMYGYTYVCAYACAYTYKMYEK